QKKLAPIVEKPPEFLLLRLIQNGKAWQWVAFASADCGRQPPDAAASGAELGDFLLGEFQQSVGRVGADGMERVRPALPQPVVAISVDNLVNLRRRHFSARSFAFQTQFGPSLSPNSSGCQDRRNGLPATCRKD